MRRSLAMMMACLLGATACAEAESRVPGEVPPDEGVEQPSEGDGDDFSGSDGFDEGSSQQDQSVDESFVGQGSFSGDLGYLRTFAVRNALVHNFSGSGISTVLEGVADTSPVMVMIDLMVGSFADLEVGRPYDLADLPHVFTLGCLGQGYETEVPGEEIEVEDVEHDPQIGETLYTLKLGFRYDRELQYVYAQFTQPQ